MTDEASTEATVSEPLDYQGFYYLGFFTHSLSSPLLMFLSLSSFPASLLPLSSECCLTGWTQLLSHCGGTACACSYTENLWLSQCWWVFPYFFHPSCLFRHPSDFRTQWETWRGRGNSFNLTTEPVSLLLLPVKEFTHFNIACWC